MRKTAAQNRPVIKHVWHINDSHDGDDDDDDMSFGTIFPSAKISSMRNGWDAIEKLKEGATRPDILFLDCVNTGMRNYHAGFDNLQRLHEFTDGYVPTAVFFISADIEYAVECRQLAIEDLGFPEDRVYATDIWETSLLHSLLSEHASTSDYSSVDGDAIRLFLNTHMGHKLPMTRDEFMRDRLDKGQVDPKDLPGFIRKGDLTAQQALVLYLKNRGYKNQGDWGSDIEEIDAPHGEYIRFARSTGTTVQGHAAYSRADIAALKKEGKKAIYIIPGATADIYETFPDIAGLVVLDGKGSGHLAIMAQASGITCLYGADTPADLAQYSSYDFVAKALKRGDPVTRLDQAGLTSIFGKLVTGLDLFEEKQREGMFRRISGSNIRPQKILWDKLWKRPFVVTPGAPVTLHRESLYSGHRNASTRDVGSFLYTLEDIYHDALEERGEKPLQIKANIDNIAQALSISRADGVGLVRTEHLALIDPVQLQALQAVFTGAQGSEREQALDSFANGQMGNLYYLFLGLQHTQGETAFPVRVRLLDAPPEEFLMPEQHAAFAERYDAANGRGVQFGLANPDLYQAQLDAIFSAYRLYLETVPEPVGPDFWPWPEEQHVPKPSVRLEIMVPTIRTVQELLAAKQMTAQSAGQHGFTTSDYSFGSMVETAGAVRNIRKIAPHAAFLSFGTNDLTSEILHVARDDISVRSTFINHATGQGDPFVTLHSRVGRSIRNAAKRAREAAPDVRIDLCGAHGSDLRSLMKLYDAKLNAVSVIPNHANLVGLRADFALYQGWRWAGRPKMEYYPWTIHPPEKFDI